jgi:outer membrane protein assembly factor BamA
MQLVRALAIALLCAACGSSPPPRRSVACAAERIGRVTVIGVAPEVVAPIAVLEGTLDDRERTARVVAHTEAMLRANGYARAAIAMTHDENCGVELAARVTLGPRYRIARIELDTPDEFPEAVRRTVLASELGGANAVGGSYRADHLKSAMTRLVTAYWDRGWVNAEAGEPRVTFDDARAEVVVHLPIKAGKRYRIREVRLRERDATGELVVATLGIHSGDWYETPRLRTAIERARRRVGKKVELWPAVLEDRGQVDLEIEVTK